MTKTEIIKQASKLSPAEKILLIEELWDSIEENNIEFSEEHRKIIRKRIEAEKQNPDEVYTWEEVKKYARNAKSKV